MTGFDQIPGRLAANPRFVPGPYPDRLRPTLSHKAAADALARISAWPGYRPTPLVSLDPLAAALGLGAILYKHEASRFGLKSFKALGGAHAVQRIIEDRVKAATGSVPSTEDLLSGRHAGLLGDLVVSCATDGNHGRSVAWGAALFGISSVIFLHETVSAEREDAIARFGARIIRTPGNYDRSVRIAAKTSAAEGWVVVSDTSWPGYEDTPRDVMQGYAVMAGEAFDQMDGVRPTHIFIQGGVGGLAAAVTAHGWEAFGPDAPLVTVVEPDQAACLFESNLAGRPVTVEGALDTIMAGLACGEPSMIAWPVLEAGAAFFMEIGDDAARATMRLLADGVIGAKLAAGESGVAGLAGLIMAAGRPDWAGQLGLGPDSRVLVFGSEGATDPVIYHEIVGRPPEAIEKQD